VDHFIQKMPWEGLAKQTITLEDGKMVIDYKSPARNFSDDYRYGNLSPDIKLVRRGATEWSNVVYGLVVTSIVFFLISKMSNSLLFKSIALGIQLFIVIVAVSLLGLVFVKREYLYVLDDTGDCVVALRATPKAKAFIGKLKQKLETTEKKTG
jgi:hypothetical protein